MAQIRDSHQFGVRCTFGIIWTKYVSFDVLTRLFTIINLDLLIFEDEKKGSIFFMSSREYGLSEQCRAHFESKHATWQRMHKRLWAIDGELAERTIPYAAFLYHTRKSAEVHSFCANGCKNLSYTHEDGARAAVPGVGAMCDRAAESTVPLSLYFINPYDDDLNHLCEPQCSMFEACSDGRRLLSIFRSRFMSAWKDARRIGTTNTPKAHRKYLFSHTREIHIVPFAYALHK